MASSSSTSRSWSYDVFPSFRGEDVRKSFLSYLLKELHRKSIHTFIDNGIERSRPIAPELLLAIEESRISIVVFSMNYASSTWCLNELVKINDCYKDSGQMVIPIFYDVDPSQVRKQTGEFGKAFEKTCKGEAEDDKERWRRALVEVASMAGYDSQNWDNEADMTEKLATDVLNKLNNITPLDDFADFVGIEAHLEKLNSMLCLESGEVRMVGIVGTSGVGKSTIARALFNKLSSQFDLRLLKPYKRTLLDRKIADISVKLSWAKQFLSDILDQTDIKIDSLGVIQQRLKHKKALIVLDDVDERELLETLVGQPGWFGFGSRIIVVTQDRELLKSHKMNLIYDVELPSEDLALQMLCRSAFGKNSPRDGFEELASEVVKLSGKLPLGVKVLGSTLSEKSKEEWIEMLPRLRDGLYSKIERTLRVSYDGLDRRAQDTFLYIACLFNGEEVNHIKNMLGNDALRILVDRSLISIRPSTKKAETVEMHGLLEQLGREIVLAESSNPGKRRILTDAQDISDVLTYHTGTETVVGIYLEEAQFKEPLSIAEKSFEGMHNLQFLNINNGMSTLQDNIVYFPHKLRLLNWERYPAKSLPSSFSGEYLVELIMENSMLGKLWEGTQPLRSLKKMILDGSDLREIPDLSNATNLEILSLRRCTSLVELPSTIRNLKNLIKLLMDACTNLNSLPPDVNLESLDILSLSECSNLRTFPRISRNISRLKVDGTAMKEEDCLWIANLTKLTKLSWENCPLRYMPSEFYTENLIELCMRYSKLEKLWEGVQSIRNLYKMDFTGCQNLIEIPDLSKASTSLEVLPTNFNLVSLSLRGCSRLTSIPQLSTSIEYLYLDSTAIEDVPSWIENISGLKELSMRGCEKLRKISAKIRNLVSLTALSLHGCSRVTSIPQLPISIKYLFLDNTAIEEVPSWIEDISGLRELSMSGCEKLRKISAKIRNLRHCSDFDFTNCGSHTAVRYANLVKLVADLHPASMQYYTEVLLRVVSDNTDFLLPRGAQEFILQKSFLYAIVPGTQVPRWYFKHQNLGSTLTVPLPQSSLSQQKLEFAGCINLGFATKFITIFVHWKFRGVQGICRIKRGRDVCKMNHQFVFHFDFDNAEEVDGSQSQFDCNNVEFEFEVHESFYFCWCYTLRTKHNDLEICSTFLPMIEECGVRVLGVSPSLDANERQDNTQDGENDAETERSSEREDNQQDGEAIYAVSQNCNKAEENQEDGENDAKTERSSQTEDNHQSGIIRMPVETSQEPSNSLCGQTALSSGLMAPNLELSLGTSTYVSSGCKVPSPSTPSRDFHGDIDGPSLSLSLTPSDPCIGGESLYSYPMITEQQETETPITDPSSSLQLINFFSQTLAPNFEQGLGGASSNFHGNGKSLSHSLSTSHPCLEEEALYVDSMTTEQQDRGGTNCQSFILFTASKLFQTWEMTFRQVSNLFCSQTDHSSN